MACNRIKTRYYSRRHRRYHAEYLCFKEQGFFRFYPARVDCVLYERIDYLCLEVAVFFDRRRRCVEIEEIEQRVENVIFVFLFKRKVVACIAQ